MVDEKLQKVQLQPAPPAPAVGDVDRRTARKRDKEINTAARFARQRLLLLRHVFKCPEEEGHCRMTPHCAYMKRLWKHMQVCKDCNCAVQHCMSSRYVLCHYCRCKDHQCPICGPVRYTLRLRKHRFYSGMT